MFVDRSPAARREERKTLHPLTIVIDLLLSCRERTYELADIYLMLSSEQTLQAESEKGQERAEGEEK